MTDEWQPVPHARDPQLTDETPPDEFVIRLGKLPGSPANIQQLYVGFQSVERSGAVSSLTQIHMDGNGNIPLGHFMKHVQDGLNSLLKDALLQVDFTPKGEMVIEESRKMSDKNIKSQDFEFVDEDLGRFV